MGVLFFLQGSQSSDIRSDSAGAHPFKPCPDSPNCLIVSREYNLEPDILFSLAAESIGEMNPHEFSSDSQTFQIEAVFRIRVFSYLDDVKATVENAGGGKSVLHIRSSSREGYSDLGVNRRRVNRILNRIDQKKINLSSR
jgi:uncharacterized protein (DUF1499 family)